MRTITILVWLLAWSYLVPQLVAAETADELLKSARTALSQGKTDEALSLAGKAIALDPKNGQAYYVRGIVYEVTQQHQEAIADFDKAIALDAKLAEAYDRRGSEHFKLGRVAESIADFDKYLELRPEDRPGHWKRGISLYYAGKFEEGAKQFQSYEMVDTNDVENAVWHYLCTARAAGVEKARATLLKIGNDKRVPMMQVYALFAGKITPEEVLKACSEGQPPAAQLNQRLFYAHLYLGLYNEVHGDKKRALEHMAKADEHKIGHYMWDVAHVHLELLRKKAEDK